jgi:5-bromo-4-chloroindolyl phosphate hydrolysis protein
MKSFLQFLFRSFAAATTTVFVWMISFLAIGNPFLNSLLIGLGAGAVVYLLLKWYLGSNFLKENGITRREYRYIKKNLKEAKEKISRLQKAMFRIRNIPDIKQNYEVIRLVNKIYVITKKEPRRFFQAEQFYFTNLDSLVELTEKYALLHSQPAKTTELTLSLKETRTTINQLTDTVEKDLYKILEDDIDDLQFELDVAKKTIDRRLSNKDIRRR